MVHLFPVGKAQFHLGGMHIYVQGVRLNMEMQHGKGILVLHHIGFICLLNGLGYNGTLDVTAIDEIIFIIPVGPGYDRLACKSGDCNPVLIDFHREKVSCNLPSEYSIYQVLQVVVS